MTEVIPVSAIDCAVRLYAPGGDTEHYRTPVGVIYAMNVDSEATTVRMALSTGGDHSGLFDSLIDDGEYDPEPNDTWHKGRITNGDRIAQGYFRSYYLRASDKTIGDELWVDPADDETRRRVELAMRGLVLVTSRLYQLSGGGNMHLTADDLEIVQNPRRGRYTL